MAVEYGDRYSVEQEILKEQATKARNAISDAVSLAGTKGAGMMYHAVGEGQRQGAGLEGLGMMLTGQEKPIDPRLARIDALESILAPHGNPDSYEDMVAIANDLRAGGFPGEADLAMKQANDYKKMETDRINALASADVVPTQKKRDYEKLVDGKYVTYTVTERYNPTTKTWDFVSEARTRGEATKTTTIQNLEYHALKVTNDDGSFGCDINDPITGAECMDKATKLYHQTEIMESELGKRLSIVAGENIQKQFDQAGNSLNSIKTIDTAFAALNSSDEPIVGAFADMRMAWAKMIGYLGGDKDEAIEATETWQAATGALVVELLGSGALGAGAGLSDNDVKFAKSMLGANPELNEGSIRRILLIRRKLDLWNISRWNQRYNSFGTSVIEMLDERGLNSQSMIVPEIQWPKDQVYRRYPPGSKKIILNGQTYWAWPNDSEGIRVPVLAKDGIEGGLWTIHDTNGFDITDTMETD